MGDKLPNNLLASGAVVFYHQCEPDNIEFIHTHPWSGSLAHVSGIIGSGLTYGTDTELYGSGTVYPSLIDNDHLAFCAWVQNPSMSGGIFTVQRDYKVTLFPDRIHLECNNGSGYWNSNGTISFLDDINDGDQHFIVCDFAVDSGVFWELKTSLDGQSYVSRGLSSGYFMPHQAATFVQDDKRWLSHPGDESIAMSSSGFTFSAWVYFYSTTGYGTIISKWLASEYEYQISRYNNQSYIKAWMSPDGSIIRTVTTPSVDLNKWHFVTFWLDPVVAQLRIQIDMTGGDYANTEDGETLHSSDTEFRIGRQTNSTNYFDGKIAMIGMWDRCLSSDEREYLYNYGSGKFYHELNDRESIKTDLVSYWDLDASTSGDLGKDSYGVNDLVNHEVTTSGTAVRPWSETAIAQATDYLEPSLDITPNENGEKWVDEVVLWDDDTAEFNTSELNYLYELGEKFHSTLDNYYKTFGSEREESLYIYGHELISSGIPLTIFKSYIYKHDTISLTISSMQILSDEITLFTHGHFLLPDSIPLALVGDKPHADEIPLVIYKTFKHVEQDPEECPLFINGHHSPIHNFVPLYVLGPTYPPGYSGCIFFHSCDQDANEWIEDKTWLTVPPPDEYVPFIVKQGMLYSDIDDSQFMYDNTFYETASGSITALFWMSGIVNAGHELHLGWVNSGTIFPDSLKTTVGVYCNGKNDILKKTYYTPVVYCSGIPFSGAVQDTLIYNETMFCVRAEWDDAVVTLKMSVDGGPFIDAGSNTIGAFTMGDNKNAIGIFSNRTSVSGLLIDECAFWGDIDEFTSVQLEQCYNLGKNKQSLIKYTDVYEGPWLDTSGAITLYTHGYKEITDSINLTIPCTYCTCYYSLPLYLYGKTVELSSCNLYVHGHQDSQSGIQLSIPYPHKQYVDNITLYLENWSAASGISLYIECVTAGERTILHDFIYMNDHDPQFIGNLGGLPGDTVTIEVWKIVDGISTLQALSNSGCYNIGDTGRWGWSTEYLSEPKDDQYFYRMTLGNTIFEGQAFVRTVGYYQRHPNRDNRNKYLSF